MKASASTATRIVIVLIGSLIVTAIQFADGNVYPITKRGSLGVLYAGGCSPVIAAGRNLGKRKAKKR
jgi:hypothetical protein